MYMWHYSDSMAWWMVVWMVMFWGAIIALVVWGIRRLTDHNENTTSKSSARDALDIAKERYARGEISREEFEQIRRDLS